MDIKEKKNASLFLQTYMRYLELVTMQPKIEISRNISIHALSQLLSFSLLLGYKSNNSLLIYLEVSDPFLEGMLNHFHIGLQEPNLSRNDLLVITCF